jgi:hypothetical protein
VLLLWWFSVGASIANACLTTGSAAPGAGLTGALVTALEARHEAGSHADMGSHHPVQADGAAVPSHHAEGAVHQGSLAKTNCQDFCGKAKVSIPPLKSVLGDAQSDAVIAATAVTVLPMPALVPAPLWVPRRDGVQAPPIPIAFLRLAL